MNKKKREEIHLCCCCLSRSSQFSQLSVSFFQFHMIIHWPFAVLLFYCLLLICVVYLASEMSLAPLSAGFHVPFDTDFIIRLKHLDHSQKWVFVSSHKTIRFSLTFHCAQINVVILPLSRACDKISNFTSLNRVDD
jgi:hypothetical protein